MTKPHQHSLDEFVAGADRQQSVDDAAESLQAAAEEAADTAPTPARVAFSGPSAVETQPYALTWADPDRRPPRAPVVEFDGTPAVYRPTRCAAVAASTGERCQNERLADATLCTSHLEAEDVTRWYDAPAG
jgi:hypothetical protein